MDQLITNQFRAALIHLLTKEGRGAQSRLAKQQNIDGGYLNAIIKGRKPGSEKIRSKIACHFDMAYEDLFILGRRILEQTESLYANSDAPLSGVLKTTESTPQNRPDDINPSNIQTKLLKTAELLESGTSYGNLLAGLIDSFHDSLNMQSENETLLLQIKEIESQTQKIEEDVDIEIE